MEVETMVAFQQLARVRFLHPLAQVGWRPLPVICEGLLLQEGFESGCGAIVAGILLDACCVAMINFAPVLCILL